jgi:chemotaxis protein MotB
MRRCSIRFCHRVPRRVNLIGHREADLPLAWRTQAFTSARRVVFFAAVLWLAMGCVSRGDFDLVVADRDQLAIERQELEDRVGRLDAANQSLSAERLSLIDESEDLRISQGQLEGNLARMARKGAELAESLEASQSMLSARNAELNKMRGVYDGLVSDLENEVSAGQIQIEKLRSGLKLNLSQAILFPSGSAKLNAQGIEVLRKVGDRLAGLPNAVEVLGHTDNKPISGRYPSNWELAAARASSVVRLFVDLGVDPSQLRAVSRGEYEPVSANDTSEGRAKNRRIEIRLAAASVSAAAAPKAARAKVDPAPEKAEPAPEPAPKKIDPAPEKVEPAPEAAEPAGQESEFVEEEVKPASGERPEIESPAQSDVDRPSAP